MEKNTTQEMTPAISRDEKVDFQFEVLAEEDYSMVYTGGCSGGRSDCCTRVCTRYAQPATAAQWGQFLEINAGVVQY